MFIRSLYKVMIKLFYMNRVGSRSAYRCLCPILKRVAISSKVLFFVSGTLRYVKTQKSARNTLNGRKV